MLVVQCRAPPQDIPNVFAAVYLLSQSSYDSVKYKRAWNRAKGIRSSILSSGEISDAFSRALSIALNHKEIASIMAVTGTTFPKQYANAITRHEQKENILSHATTVGNKRKQTEDRKTFVISNIVCIGSSPSKKQIKMKLMQFMIYFNVESQVHIVNKKQLLQNVEI